MVTVLLLATVALLSLRPQNVQAMKAAFLQVISPFLKTGNAAQRQITSVTKGLKTLEQLEDENQRLIVENKNLKAINQTLRNLEEDNNRLRRALQYKERSIFKLIPARIVSRETGTWWSTVTINCGSDKGLEPDMPVVTEDGLVGKTTTVSKSISEVVLVTDERLQVAVDVEGTQEQGIVQGARVSTMPVPLLSLNFLSKDAKLEPGQKVYSSGIQGGVFPAGLLIGTIASTTKRALDTQAQVAPAVNFGDVEDVFVVVTGMRN